MRTINTNNGFVKMYRDVYHDFNLTAKDVVLISYIISVYPTLWEKEIIDGVDYYRMSTNYVRNEVPVLSERDVPNSFDNLIKYGYIQEWRPNKNIKGLRYIRLSDCFTECLRNDCNNDLHNDLHNDCKNLTTNNNIKSKEDKTNISVSKDTDIPPAKKERKQKPEKHYYGTFQNVLLTDDELKKLQEEFKDWSQKIDNLSYYLGSSGKSYKSHYMTILNWARKDAENSSKPSVFNPTFFSQPKNVVDDESNRTYI